MVFFPAVVLLYYVMPKRLRALWLLLASYYFYMGWNPKYALLILTSTLISYICALAIDRLSGRRAAQRGVMASGIALNMAILFFYKYFGFFTASFSKLCAVFGIRLMTPEFDIILPVGISFYTFQAAGYVIDVYRGDTRAEKNFIQYALFVSFFPQLVAGPIERSGSLLSQLNEIGNRRLWSFEKAVSGLLLMLWGFFMKLVIADRAAVVVNQVFGIYYMFDSLALFTALILFAIQIYCDFAGYSFIAKGAARVLGIELIDNFKSPFLSKSVKELWGRWHISLSSWFRDYVYIPLGGNRLGRARKYLNNMITFTVSGLWHGANWTYVLWGMLQGLFIMLEDMARPFFDNIYCKYRVKTSSIGFRVFQVVKTFGVFLLSLAVFRSRTIKDAFYYIYRLFACFDIWSVSNGSVYTLGLDRAEMNVLFLAVLILFLADLYYEKRKLFFDGFIKSQCLPVQLVTVAFVLVMVVVFGVYGEGYDAAQFIYFQF